MFSFWIIAAIVVVLAALAAGWLWLAATAMKSDVADQHRRHGSQRRSDEP